MKILLAITRSPKMSDLIYKADRKRMTDQMQKQMQDEAILTLRQYRFNEGDNVGKFVDNLYKEVFEQVAN